MRIERQSEQHPRRTAAHRQAVAVDHAARTAGEARGPDWKCPECGENHVIEPSYYTCPECGYDQVTANNMGTCPECGHQDYDWIDDRAEIDRWIDNQYENDPARYHRYKNDVEGIEDPTYAVPGDDDYRDKAYWDDLFSRMDDKGRVSPRVSRRRKVSIQLDDNWYEPEDEDDDTLEYLREELTNRLKNPRFHFIPQHKEDDRYSLKDVEDEIARRRNAARKVARQVTDHEFKPYSDNPEQCVAERPGSGNTCNRSVEDHALVPGDVLRLLRGGSRGRRPLAVAAAPDTDAQAWAARPGNRDWSGRQDVDSLMNAWAETDPSGNYGEHNEEAWYEMMYRAENGDPDLQDWYDEQLANLADEDGAPAGEREYPDYRRASKDPVDEFVRWCSGMNDGKADASALARFMDENPGLSRSQFGDELRDFVRRQAGRTAALEWSPRGRNHVAPHPAGGEYWVTNDYDMEGTASLPRLYEVWGDGPDDYRELGRFDLTDEAKAAAQAEADEYDE